MTKNIDLTSQEWIDIIFEGKNKSYGAYTLRQQSSKRHLLAFIVTIAFMAVAILSVNYAVKANMKARIARGEGYSGKISVSILDIPEPPKDIIEHRIEAPPPIDLAKTIKLTGVVTIKKDDLVKSEDEVKGQTEIFNDPLAVISIIDNEAGRTDGLGIDPADLEKHKIIVDLKRSDEDIYDLGSVEQNPSFPGGESAMYEWLGKHINYPAIAQELNIQGRVSVQFVVGKNGEIENIIIARGVDANLDKEALRVVKSMPAWIPGKQNGNAVKVRYTLPIQFRLQ